MESWLQPAGSAGLFFLSFLSEDAATLAGATLSALGKMSLVSAFLACFSGIWLGDLGLYALARFFGRPVLDRLCPVQERLDQSEAWFARYGLFALVMCRFIPGTRLPTFLAAGLLRMPVGRFATVTGLLAAAWVAIFFLVVCWFGGVAGLAWNSSHRLTLGVAAGVALLIFLTRGLWFPPLRRLSRSPAMQRWLQWEFWPAWLFYLPVALNYLRLAIKYRGLTLPTCANPGMFTGGLIGESKYETLCDLSGGKPEWTAPSFLVPCGPFEKRMAGFREGMEAAGLEFPIVLKPDVAQRGSGFKAAKSVAEVEAYLGAVNVPVVAQRYIPGPHEAGLFYYRFPSRKAGQIFAITEKIFPVIFGDGNRTVEELIQADARAAIMAGVYLKRFQRERGRVLAFGQCLRLVEAGNHAQGCIFRDGMHLWSEQLEARIDEISQSIPGFYIGRYDVRFPSLEEFQQGRGFTILELNGAASEATSAYDAGKSLGAAYQLLFEQWELVFAIAAENRDRGHKPDSVKTILSEWRRYRENSLCHPLAD